MTMDECDSCMDERDGSSKCMAVIIFALDLCEASRVLK